MMPILAQVKPVFQPAMRVISSITNSAQALVTTTIPHQYDTGMIVRLNLPQGFTMQQVNQKTGIITVINPTSFVVDIDTSLFEPFSSPTSFPDDRQYAQVTPVGEINSSLSDATRNVLPY
jgi:hypothetical protein